ncbi:MAG: twin-arginine translocase subunit TatC [Bacteroidetes bacterium]|nr:twin-arginine translocase subunit TatC [Bacteroidota bacterium]
MRKELNGDKPKVKEMGFFDHLEELRWHLFRSVIVILVFAIVAFLFKRIVFEVIILGPKDPSFITNDLLCRLGQSMGKSILCINSFTLEIINTTMAGQFLMHIRISMIAGFLIAFPYIIFEFWKFVRPALYNTEQKAASFTIFAVNILFFVGVLVGYFIIAPLSINFLGKYNVSNSVNNMINLSSYISNISSICFAAGIVFELPVLTYFLSKLGIVTPQFMRRYRKHAFVVILILSSILTPPDVMSQILIAFPLILLYEVSIRISKSVINNKSKEVSD